MRHPAAPVPRGLNGGGPGEHRIRPVVPPRAYSPGEGGQFDWRALWMALTLSLLVREACREKDDVVPRVDTRPVVPGGEGESPEDEGRPPSGTLAGGRRDATDARRVRDERGLRPHLRRRPSPRGGVRRWRTRQWRGEGTGRVPPPAPPAVPRWTPRGGRSKAARPSAARTSRAPGGGGRGGGRRPGRLVLPGEDPWQIFDWALEQKGVHGSIERDEAVRGHSKLRSRKAT
mmetsp:Transcript_25842/g.61369  ORF Transcript_25842/g.61369 Transcript_25842/m.61369 type:complete len:231 (-) Transcript_25842:60-752(-)